MAQTRRDFGLNVLARQMADERDMRFAQLKASEAEADRYRVALRKIADSRSRTRLGRRMRKIAKEALGDV